MHRIDDDDALANANGPGRPGFTEGDPEALVPATRVRANWANALQEEVCGVVEAAVPLDDTAHQQMRQVLEFAFAILAAGTLVNRFTAAGVLLAAASDDGSNIVAITSGSGTDSRVVSAPDGWNFAQRDLGSGTANELTAIVWAPGPRLFVACGRNGEIQTSPDGITWTKRTQASAYGGDWSSAAASNSVIVLVGADSMIQTSVDGITWTVRVPAAAAHRVAYSPSVGLFLAIGSNAQTSPDGITWTLGPAIPYYAHLGPSPFGFIAADDVEEKIATTRDGATWTVVLSSSIKLSPHHVSQSGIITGRSVDNRWRAAISTARPSRAVAVHLGTTLHKLMHTRAAWVGAEGSDIYVSQGLPF